MSSLLTSTSVSPMRFCKDCKDVISCDIVIFLSTYAAVHCGAVTFDLGASDIAIHSVDTALDGIAAYVAAHCSDRADVAIDCDIGARGGEGVDGACDFDFNDWTVVLVVLFDWLAVDENLAVGHLETRAVGDVDGLAVVGYLATDATDGGADGLIVDYFHIVYCVN